jgi:hypothetical protein
MRVFLLAWWKGAGMSSPIAHAAGALGAYLSATGPKSAGKIRGAGLLGICTAVALLPDIVALSVSHASSDVVTLLRGVSCGLVISGSLAGAVPSLRNTFWLSAAVLLAARSSQALVEAAGPGGGAWFAPLDSHAMRLGPVLVPAAGVRVLNQPFLAAIKVMLVEIGILLPLVWTAWVLGRESGASKTKAWLVAYAASWPLGVGLAYWCVRSGGRL